MTVYHVWEASLHDPEGTIIATFDLPMEAREYVQKNEEQSLFAGYGLFVVPSSDK